MEKDEIELELGMSYRELVNYLLKKYGPAKGDYFRNETCRSKNPIVSRSDEGLECHHIDEDKAIMLSMTNFAIRNPYKYQRADRLVYANLFEHLILHLKIVKEPLKASANVGEAVGIGGAINLICLLNDYYNGYEFKRPYLVKATSMFENNFDEYIEIILELLRATTLTYNERFINKEIASQGSDGKIVKKVYERLKPAVV